MPVVEAKLYYADSGDVVCGLCNHRCRIRAGGVGLCGVRENRNGRLVSLVYGELVAQHVDPMEKKPLFHVLPGSLSYSISTYGCNFRCSHCQNHTISQVADLKGTDLRGMTRTKGEVVHLAQMQGCRSISYTYVEPTVFFEFAADCMIEAVKKGLKNIFVSNGYMTCEAVREMTPYLHAINIDIKSFSDVFYRKICGAHLQPVLDTVKLIKDLGIWVEVTTLVIPGLNDSDEELQDIGRFIHSVDPAIPWHVSGFYPTYKMLECSPTSMTTLVRAEKIGREQGLQFVYRGNMPGSGGEDTQCPACGAHLIRRAGFRIIENVMVDGRCPSCSCRIPGLWS